MHILTETTLKLPLYVNDNGVVMCDITGDCEGYTYETIGRRCTLDDLITEIIRHAKEDHGMSI